ncbi:Uncharacterised protein [uncultured Clostridium sp.]|uniref:hypothetical protein n=1 Tax=uncultured Clostridium sp. TaxID=59620 RepID=UPI000820D796|nr:hypothetical protein [uncultured Clostridium sp.]SCJ89766.1 Uncharacterised protein [uncultured Clostridium sp.]
MSEANIRDNICCPSCGSNNLKIIVEKENENYDLFSGILGAVCLGPIGMLCGLCCAEGEKKRTTCICNDCGMRFNG